MRNYLMEFIGTMFLVLAIGFSNNPLAIGLMLMAMVYMGGHISGGHYNPAVTLAVFIRGKIEGKFVAGYMISQVLGAFTAALIFYLINSHSFYPAPAEGVVLWKTILLELIFTFALCSVVLATATNEKISGNYIYGLAIGLTVTASAYSVGSITGGAFNPSVFLGPMLMDVITGGTSYNHLLLYLIGPFSGGVLAAIVYKYLNKN
ncbi:MAG: aquaporin [Bacteroidetes bacterium]|nr:aquaporin [Bacteroidota bacterium]